MKKISVILIIVAAATMMLCSANSPENPVLEKEKLTESVHTSRHTAITRAIESASPAVVGIHVTQIKEYAARSIFDDPLWNMMFPGQVYRQRVKSMGSGVIISADGLVVTNAHVVEDAVETYITLAGGSEYKAQIIGADKLTDIALLKIDRDEAFPSIKIGNSDDIIIGEWAVALGNPFGLFDVNNQPTATLGIISSINLDFGEQDGRVYQDMIQTDASINTGNSGGALVNVLGELIGINTFIFTGGGANRGSVGVGFAIPVSRVKEIVAELHDKGQVDRGFETGMAVQNIDRYLAAFLQLPVTRGVIVTDVLKGSSAEKAGIVIGDVIMEVNSRLIQNDRDIYRVINEGYLKAGDKLELKIWRNGDSIKRTLVLEKPKEKGKR
ncbi:MAG TPA: trypsin-like serine protease [Candidatus Marinimicrobia bacterium]|nr:trypsin-like serine protease [Candidatus Neomarinimicrobiota bacterium]